MSSTTAIECTLVEKLRRYTREAHESMERRVDLPARLKSINAYRGLLERFYGFFRPLENGLRWTPGIFDVIPDLEHRLRGDLLARDLAHVGLLGTDIQNLPRCRELPPMKTPASALGCLYVLEGSTLGGRIIAKQVRALGPRAYEACVFFLSNGDDVGARWKQFGVMAETFAASHPDRTDEICHAARQTFACLERWLSNV